MSLIARRERGGAGGAGGSQERETKCDHFLKDSMEEGENVWTASRPHRLKD